MNENWTDDLRRRMEQYESAEVPEGLWEGIEQRLDQSPRGVVVPMWWRWAAACAVVAIVVGVGVLLKPLPASPGGGEGSEAGGLAYDKRIDEKTLVADVNENPSVEHSVAVAVPQMVVTHIDTVQELRQEVAEVAEIVATERAVEDDAVAENHPSAPQSYSHSEGVSLTNDVRKSTHRTDLRVALYATQMPRDESLGMNGYYALSEHGTPDNSRPMLAKGNIGNFDYLALVNDGKNPVSNAHHHQPVRFGLSAGYDIDQLWGVSVGATYTKLRSTLTAGTESSYYTNDQTLYYLGVPVGVSYNLLRNHYLRLYAKAGGMIEFGCGGNIVVETVTKNRHVSTERHDLDDIPVQLSANIGGGAEFRVYRSLGIFVEVGAAYYFDNNSKYTTIYSAHPLNLDLQFGIRWTLNTLE